MRREDIQIANIKVPLIDLAAVVNSQKSTIAAANRELDKYNKKAKDASLDKSDLERIQRVEGIRDQAKQGLKDQAAVVSQNQNIASAAQLASGFGNLSAIQKLTRGQALNASDAFAAAVFLEKPVLNLIQKFKNSEKDKQQDKANNLGLSSFNLFAQSKNIGVQLDKLKEFQLNPNLFKEDFTRNVVNKFDPQGALARYSSGPSIAPVSSSLIPDSLKYSGVGIPSGSLLQKLAIVGPVLELAKVAVDKVLQKIEERSENEELASKLLSTHIRGTLNFDQKERLSGNDAFFDSTRSYKEYFDNPVKSINDNAASQKNLTSTFGNSAANVVFRDSLKPFGLESAFDEAIQTAKNNKGGELTAEEYELIRSQFLSRKDLVNAIGSYEQTDITKLRLNLNDARYADNEILRLYNQFKIKGRDLLGYVPGISRVSRSEAITDLNNETAAQFAANSKLSEEQAYHVLTINETIAEKQISNLETWYSEHRRSRTYYPLTPEHFHYNRMGQNIILVCLISSFLMSLI